MDAYDDPVIKNHYSQMVKMLAAAEAKYKGQPVHVRQTELPAGTVSFGGDESTFEYPVNGFFISTEPVTAADYNRLEGKDIRLTDGFAEITFADAARFCNDLSKAAGYAPVYTIDTAEDSIAVTADFSADGYRLPTLAEWKYAALYEGDMVLYESFRDASRISDGSSNKGEICWNIYSSHLTPEVMESSVTDSGDGAYRTVCWIRNESEVCRNNISVDDSGYLFRVVRNSAE